MTPPGLVTDHALEGRAAALFEAAMPWLLKQMKQALGMRPRGAFCIVAPEIVGLPSDGMIADLCTLDDAVLTAVPRVPRARARALEASIRAPVVAGSVRLVIVHPSDVAVRTVAHG